MSCVWPSAGTASSVLTIQPGMTCPAIALNYGLSLSSLASLNTVSPGTLRCVLGKPAELKVLSCPCSQNPERGQRPGAVW